MGKVKSAIITTIVTLAVLVLFLFCVVSCPLPNGVDRYNGIVTGIHLGSELTGDAYATILPDGVITAEEYDLTTAVDSSTDSDDTDDDATEKAQEYKDTYVAVSGGSYYVDKDVLADYLGIDSGSDSESELTEEQISEALALLTADVEADAAIISDRLGIRRYTSYSVSVVDGVAIRLSVPTNFSYASYSSHDNTNLTTDLTYVSTAISYLTLSGELTLRNKEYGRTDALYSSQNASGSSTITRNILTDARASISDYIKSVTYYASGGSYAVRIKLTSEGQSALETATTKVADSDDTYIRFYVGETNVINLTCESAITDSSFYISVDSKEDALNYVALLSSAASGNTLSLDYSYDDVIYDTAATGTNTAMFLAIAVLALALALMAYAIARYRKLGLVFALMELLFCSAMIAIIFLTGITLTTIGVFVAIASLVMFAGCNFVSFEAIRGETKNGRTIRGSVKTGYKKTFTGVLDLHIVLLIVSIMLALICFGEASACGIVLLIGVCASYLLHWFTRFMWYVTMSPARDKYKYCGFKREALEDDE